jgi:hypothetical protein
LMGMRVSSWSSWCERFRRPIRSADLMAMYFNLLLPAVAWQGYVLSVV